MAQRKPPWLDQIRFMAAYYLSGCEAPWSLYAEAAQDEAGDIAAVFLSFGLKDYVKQLFRPKGLRSKRHGRKGRKNGRGLPGIPELSNEAANRTPGRDLLANRKYGLGTAAFYVIDDVIERLTWSIALIEMSSDLVYSSLLGVLEHEGAKCPNIGRLARKGGFHVEGGAGPIWTPINQGALQYAFRASSPSQSLFFLDSGNWSVTLGMKVRAPSGARQIRVRFRRTEAGFPVLAITDVIDVPTSGTADVILHMTTRGNLGFAVEGAHDGGFWDVVVSDIQLLQII